MSSPISTDKVPRISITVRGANGYEKLSGWEGLSIEKSIDSAGDGFAFRFPYDPNSENKNRFRPFGTQAVKVYVDDELLITGYVENVGASTGVNNRSLEIQGRSVTGTLVDWSAGYVYDPNKPVSQLETAFQFEGMKFNDIARRVSGPNEVIAEPDAGPFPDVAIEPGQSIFQFLSSLAAANGLWARTTPQGGLRFVKIKKTAPVADLIEGTSPVTSVSTGHDVTQRFRGFIAVAQEDGNPEVSATAEDTYMALGIRGVKIIQPLQRSENYKNTAEFARARSLINSYVATVNVTGWTHGGAFWKPGETVRLYAPGAFVNQYTPLIIKRANFKLDENSGQTTTLDLTFPEAYENRLPEVLPWEG